MGPVKMKNTGSSRNPKGQSEKKSSIEGHDERLRKLEEEREDLLEKKEEGMFTKDDEAKLDTVEKAISKYNVAMTQANLSTTTGPIPDSSAVTEGDTVGQNVTGQAVTEQHATEHNATEHDATENDMAEKYATEQNTTAYTPDRRTTNVNAQESPSRHAQIKREGSEESKVSTNRLVDNLNMAWDVNVNNTYRESLLQNHPKEAFGHLTRNSRTRYCVRYGSADARSARFESMLPDGSRYEETRDVTQRSNRIVEQIVQFHRDRKTALPNILNKVKILLVYWDSKRGVGHDAEVDVLAPDFPERRPHTRCFIYLDPALYANYKIENVTGYSHETRSTIKLLMDGNDDRQKSITLHNIAVRLENQFEKKWMSGVPGRPEPLCELVQERKVVSRRSRSRYPTAEPSASPTLMKPPISPRQPTPLPEALMKPSVSPRPLTPLQETRHEHAPTGAKPGMSLKQRFHNEFLELFELPENVTYADLTEQQQLLYPAQFTKWKAANA
ncbi:hypothetical protein L13192_12508 [Pyrenophora tritici-repentis]|nr:hypothetical protein L13192_12508 [Pyrenophora tritici-repentis]